MTQIYHCGPAPLISALYDQLKIGETIDKMVEWDPVQCRLSPGKRIKAIVINIFGGRKPLYLLDEFYENMDIENLFGKGANINDFKDYNLARSLDKLANRGPQEVFSTLCLQAICHEQIEIKYLHNDTTSISVYGAYEEEENDFVINQGHSKQKRPDLNQFLYGLSVTQDKVPVCAEVKSGNTSDKSWNFGFIQKLAENFDQDTLNDIIYVADSSMVTENNLMQINKYNLKFVSRLPGNFNLEKELKARAWEKNTFEELGTFSEEKGAAVYQAQEFKEELYGQNYRFLVIHSSKLDGRKTRSFDKKLTQREKELEKAIKKIEKNTYACEPDAEAALKDFQKQYGDSIYSIAGEIFTLEKRKPGRPGKNNPKKTFYSLKLRYSTNEAEIQKEKERLSCFVLITNLDDECSPSQLLKEYKAQSSVETSFKFLKDPFFVGPVYLKTPERVEALAYVMLIALLMFGILERRVREALKEETEPLIIPGKKKTFEPTGKKILESLSYVLVMTTSDPYRRAFSNSFEVPRVLKLAGFNEDIYLDVKDML